MSKKLPKVCRECDEYAPHPWIPGQRRVICDSCGYASHWIEGSFSPLENGAAYVYVTGGFQADWRDGEYDVTSNTEGRKFEAGKRMRITLCCLSVARSDLR